MFTKHFLLTLIIAACQLLWNIFRSFLSVSKVLSVMNNVTSHVFVKYYNSGYSRK